MTSPPATAPSLRRRLAAFVYEGVVLFGVLMISGWLYSALTQQRHALQGRVGLQIFVFLVLAVYFVWFWTHGGQTVAMRAWRIRLVSASGNPLGQARAFARYLLAWMWFVPGLVIAWAADLHRGGALAAALAAGAAGYAATAWLRPDRQFMHDVLCGTRLVDVDPRPA